MDAALAGEVLGNASGVLMLTLAVSVVAAIAFVPLRPYASAGPLGGLLADVAVLVALGAAVSYLVLIVTRPQPPVVLVIYAAVAVAQVAWLWRAIRGAPTRGVLLAALVLNLGALPFAVAEIAANGLGDVLGLTLLQGAGALVCALLLWPPTRRGLAERLASADAVASGRAAAIAIVGIVVLLGVAGPGHGHVG
jgi:hypothetical protein